MRLLLQHRSHYSYDTPAYLGPHTLRLRPAAHTRARVETYRLLVEQEHKLRWQQDPYGNHVARVSFADEPVHALDVLVELAVEVRPVNPFDFTLEDVAEKAPFAYPPELRRELAPFLSLDDPAFARGERFAALDAELPHTGGTVPLITALNREVNARVKYVIREEPGVYTPEECLAAGRASCRDSAVLLCALLRARGLAARFVSGYLIQLTDEGMLPDEPRGVSRDVVDLHAWAEVFLPGAGWVGMDATSGLLCGEGHIPLCGAATPSLASPLEGTATVAASGVSFEMKLGRLGHEARPTTPYPPEVWAELRAAGDAVDARLAAHGVKLTMGGEPTFNSREHVDEPEWNGAALGPTKWAHGLRLVQELKKRLAPGALVMHRHGKWYPGESLPRWSLDVIGRRHAGPLWPERPSLSQAKPSAADASRFVAALAWKLRLADGIHRAYEDPWRVLQDEASAPVEVDPRRANLDDPEERRRLARLLTRGVSTIAGYVLPIAPAPDGASWLTERWQLRRGELYLLPGDSPIGLRLPLGSLGAAPPPAPLEEEPVLPPDPRRELELAAEARRQAHQIVRARGGGGLAQGIRTALCVEEREGAIWVFLPPLTSFERFCQLVAAIDASRVETGLDVRVEGYGPPPAAEAYRFSVTPDPGVLEVNVPPVASMREHETLIEHVFAAALHAGLHSEKYLVDGRMAGSGGGNHITMGGATPQESPFLQRPDLLASLLTFLQHHPSLSYLFSGLFVGPTSQAPRVDEARHDALYELEIALERAFAGEPDGGKPPPWRCDALFRHLLVDHTGNTHRAEVSIDKLFDPQTPHGRQGLVELRAFEMPPHPRMVHAQVLLARALVAAFAKEPYQAPLVRWGQALHDRFLLPYAMWRDFEDVLAELARRGVTLPAEGYRPFLELRCPLVGTLQAGDVTLEVRNAIEPWHVLGEEQGASGTSRYVDSSMERIEVRVAEFVPERHVVLVNGHVLPLHATPLAGQLVGGVRFRAWAPPHSLHPHLGIHHPVRLDVVDTWARRSLGGCAYHVWHPEGRSYDSPPLTRFEASARRAQRFTLDGPSPWPVAPRAAAAHGDAPWTLDLRRLPIDRPMPRAEAAKPDAKVPTPSEVAS